MMTVNIPGTETATHVAATVLSRKAKAICRRVAVYPDDRLDATVREWKHLQELAREAGEDSKADIFAACIERVGELVMEAAQVRRKRCSYGYE